MGKGGVSSLLSGPARYWAGRRRRAHPPLDNLSLPLLQSQRVAARGVGRSPCRGHHAGPRSGAGVRTLERRWPAGRGLPGAGTSYAQRLRLIHTDAVTSYAEVAKFQLQRPRGLGCLIRMRGDVPFCSEVARSQHALWLPATRGNSRTLATPGCARRRCQWHDSRRFLGAPAYASTTSRPTAASLPRYLRRTPAFAVDTISAWWQPKSEPLGPGHHLLLLATQRQ